MKYLVLYEDFFSIFPSNHYETLLDVNVAIVDIISKIIETIPGFTKSAGEYGGINICYNNECFTYKAFEFDMNQQIITLHVSEGRMLISTLTSDSRELKKTLLSDIKSRFNLS